jgi:hypothetical protein
MVRARCARSQRDRVFIPAQHRPGREHAVQAEGLPDSVRQGVVFVTPHFVERGVIHVRDEMIRDQEILVLRELNTQPKAPARQHTPAGHPELSLVDQRLAVTFLSMDTRSVSPIVVSDSIEQPSPEGEGFWVD